MKKFCCMLLLLLFVLVLPENGHAAAGTNKIFLDGKELAVGQNVQIENVNSTVMVPLRMIAENLGYKVEWDQKSQQITIGQQSKTIQLIVNQKSASVDEKTVVLTTAPLLKNDTTLVPIRFISEQFGLTVDWDNKDKIVSLVTPVSTPDNGNPTGDAGNGTSTPVPPSDTTNNLTQVNGVSFNNNQLLITMQGASQPKATILKNPDRLVIDFPNATFSNVFGSGQQLDSNLNGKLDVVGYPDVSGVRYSLFSTSPYTVRFVVDLNYAKNYTINVSADENKLVIVDLNAADTGETGTLPGNSGRKLVVLDAGHGAKDSGAIGITGKYEKAFNLAVILKAAELLKKEQNIDVVLTRSDDTFLELKDRVAIANNLKADLFISVHANSGASSSASGTETYYQREASKAFANVMHKYLIPATGLSDRGVRYGNFHVIRETKMPAVLLEVGYLSNKGDEALLFTEALQNRVAAAMVSAIKEYLGLK